MLLIGYINKMNMMFEKIKIIVMQQ